MAIFWGGTFISGRALAGHVSPFAAAFLRFALASVFLLIVVARRNRGIPRIPARSIGTILLLGLTGVFTYNALFFKGLQTVQAGRAAVIIANNPVFIAVFAAIIFKEKLGWIKRLGILLSVTGAIMVIARGNPGSLLDGSLGWGEFFIFGCVASWVTFSLLGKKVLASLSPLVAITYASVVGTIALFVPACLEGMMADITGYSLTVWCHIGYLGFFGTVLGFVWYYEGIERIGPTKAGLFINFVPISAVLMAFFLLKEPITPSLLWGTIMVAAGVYLTNTGLAGLISKCPDTPSGA